MTQAVGHQNLELRGEKEAGDAAGGSISTAIDTNKEKPVTTDRPRGHFNTERLGKNPSKKD